MSLLVILGVLIAGSAVVYAPVVLGSYVLRRNKLKAAWTTDPKRLPGRTRDAYAEMLLREAIEAHQRSDHQKAIEASRRVLLLQNDNAQASRLLIASLFTAGDFSEAEHALKNHMMVHTDDHAAKLVPAAIYCEQRLYDRARMALDDLEPSILVPEDRALWYNNYAYTLAKLEVDLDVALEYGEQALELAAPADKQYALRTLGVVHLARQEPNEAITVLSRALKQSKNLREGDVEFTRYHLGRALLSLGHRSEAVAEFQKIQSGSTPYAKLAQSELDSLTGQLSA